MNINERMKVFDKIMGQVYPKTEVEYLKRIFKQMGFFTAPASTKYHGNYEGGLFDHSLEVTKNLLHLTKHLHLAWSSPKSPYIVGMAHDLCKCDNYVRNDDGTYSYNPYTTIPGHGEKSLVLLKANEIGLTEEEKSCIRWHMGAFDDKENWNLYGEAIEQFPNVLWTHTADMMASRIKGI